jgi:hypothetical protein
MLMHHRLPGTNMPVQLDYRPRPSHPHRLRLMVAICKPLLWPFLCCLAGPLIWLLFHEAQIDLVATLALGLPLMLAAAMIHAIGATLAFRVLLNSLRGGESPGICLAILPFVANLLLLTMILCGRLVAAAFGIF